MVPWPPTPASTTERVASAVVVLCVAVGHFQSDPCLSRRPACTPARRRRSRCRRPRVSAISSPRFTSAGQAIPMQSPQSLHSSCITCVVDRRLPLSPQHARPPGDDYRRGVPVHLLCQHLACTPRGRTGPPPCTFSMPSDRASISMSTDVVGSPCSVTRSRVVLEPGHRGGPVVQYHHREAAVVVGHLHQPGRRRSGRTSNRPGPRRPCGCAGSLPSSSPCRQLERLLEPVPHGYARPHADLAVVRGQRGQHAQRVATDVARRLSPSAGRART